jgi:hypothetical protein
VQPIGQREALGEIAGAGGRIECGHALCKMREMIKA